MPRRRVTKAPARRPRPKLPEGDEGNNLSELERKEKLRVFLADFDLDVTEKLNMLEAEKKKVMTAADVQFHTLISQIPVSVRKMKMKDFIEAGGTIAAALEAISMAESRLSDSFSMQTSHRGRMLDSILEDTPSACEPPSHSKASTVKRTRPTRKKVLSESTNMPPPSTSSSRSSRFRTPAAGTYRSGWETPLVTPKFNPRLPTTPEGERLPKPGERLMSMDGSPICIDPNKRQKTSVIPVSVQGKITNVQLPPDVIPEGDTDVSIQRLHALLSSYLEGQSKAS